MPLLVRRVMFVAVQGMKVIRTLPSPVALVPVGDSKCGYLSINDPRH